MKYHLQLLIEALQQECDRLEAEMKVYIDLWEFSEAGVWKNAWLYTRDKLHILRQLENPHYEEILHLKNNIRDLKQKLDNQVMSDPSINKILDRIGRNYRKIDQLELQKKKPFIDGDVLLSFLDKLANWEIHDFDLEIEEEYLIQVTRIENSLKIDLRLQDQKPLDYSISDQGIAVLKQMNFSLSVHSAWIIIQPFVHTKHLPILEMLARITFDVFHVPANCSARIRYWYLFYQALIANNCSPNEFEIGKCVIHMLPTMVVLAF